MVVDDLLLDSPSMKSDTDPNELLEDLTDVVRSPPPMCGKAKVHWCPVCQQEVSSSVALERHLHSLHPLSREFACLEYTTSFNTQCEVSSHKVNVHRSRKVKCKRCPYTTVSKGKMRQHIRRHMGGQRCGKCMKTFPSLS